MIGMAIIRVRTKMVIATVMVSSLRFLILL